MKKKKPADSLEIIIFKRKGGKTEKEVIIFPEKALKLFEGVFDHWVDLESALVKRGFSECSLKMGEFVAVELFTNGLVALRNKFNANKQVSHPTEEEFIVM